MTGCSDDSRRDIANPQWWTVQLRYVLLAGPGKEATGATAFSRDARAAAFGLAAIPCDWPMLIGLLCGIIPYTRVTRLL